MRFSVSVVDGPSGRERVVLLDAEPTHTVSDVLPALITATGWGEVHTSFAKRVSVWVDGRPADHAESLRGAGLAPGSVVSLHEPGGWSARLPSGTVEVRVVGGQGAGRVHRAGLGDTIIGFGAVGLSLPDVLLPPDAITLRVATDGSVTVRAAPGVPALLGEEELTDERDWPVGAYLRCGSTVLELVRPWTADADVSPSQDQLGRDVNRPPRLLPPPWSRSFTFPKKPEKPRRTSIPWAMVLAPMAMAVPSAFLFGSWRYLLLGLLSPVMAVFNYLQSRRGSARDYQEATEKYDKDTATVTDRIETALVTERTTRRAELPDPAELLLTAIGPGRRLWERRRSDPDYLVWRIGVADRPSTITVADPNIDTVVEEVVPRVVHHVPVGLHVRQNGVIGLTGHADRFDAVARWLVGQTAVLHSPRDVRIILVTDAEGEQRFGWTRWLPHCRVDGEVVPATLGTDQESIARRVGELSQLVADRKVQMEKTIGVRDAVSPAPDYVVVLDGARRFRALPGVVTLLRDGPATGVLVLCIDEDRQSLPEECRAIISCTDDLVSLRQSGAEDVDEVLLDLVEPAWADRVGHALAPIRDTTPSIEDSGLPRSARLLDCIGMPDPTGTEVAGRWDARGSTEIVVGAGFDGLFRLDLRRDGPHALVAGTTGSGKSELLQTLVASLAVANRPDQLTFVLVDYKGGSAFKECNKLPHTVGMVTDLDTHLVERALTSLGAELRRREHLLEGPGAKDLEDYWALQRSDPSLPAIPRLVLVIDEFASLKAELPDFVTGLVTIAQRGRSLGIHLVLATQRPSGVISADIRANTNLRIALRVTDESESRDVIDAPDSGHILATTPGRGYARLGPSGVLPFQAGRVGGRRPDHDVDPDELEAPLAWPVPWSEVGHVGPARPKPVGSDTDEGETDLSVLVAAITEATTLAGVPDQYTPWLPALPESVTAAGLAEAAALGPQLPAEIGGRTVAWALEDRPDLQQQTPTRFTLGRSGHLYVVGGPRSGRSTVLRTLTATLAEKVAARDLHVYALDCGNGAMLPLTSLPHTGAVVQRTEVERASRLIQRLLGEVSRRQDVLAQSGFADIDEQRAGTPDPEHRLPYVLFLIDRWEGFQSDLADVDLGSLFDGVVTLLREGASVGVQVVVTGDRSLLGGRTAALVERKFLLRLPDRGDYPLAGLKVRDLPESFPDGRGVWGETAVEAQVALLVPDPTGAAQSAAVRDIADRVAGRDAGLPPSLRPMRLGALATSVAMADVAADLRPEQRPPGWVPLGVGGDAVELLGVDLLRTPTALVAGAPRTGRTSALRFVAAYLARAGRQVVVMAPRPNALTEDVPQEARIIGTDAEPDALVTVLRTLPPYAVVLVDDAEAYREGVLSPVLLALVRQAADKEIGLVVAGLADALASGFSGWLYEARRGRQGLVMSPSEAVAAEVFSARVARASLQARPLPGRAVLFDPTGDQVPVQVPDVG